VPGLIRRLWRIAAGTFAVVVILLAVLVGLARLALVQVPEYRDQIEAWAGEVLGWPVEIEAMDARLGLRGPELRFSNARVLTQDRQDTLVVATTGAMQFDSLSLLRGSLRPGAVSLAEVSLRIERSVEGRWRLLGEEGPALGDGAATADAPAADLPFLEALPAGKLRLEDLRVEIVDLRRELGPWELLVDALDLQLGGGRLEISLTSVLPESLGAELALAVTVTGQDERGRPRDWLVGASFSALDMAALAEASGRAQKVPAAGIVDGNFTVEADAAGLLRVAGDVAARDFRLPHAPDGKPVEHSLFAALGASFHVARTGTGWHARLSDLEVARDGRRWASAEALMTLEADPAARRVEMHADQLELADLALLAPWLPPAARARIEALAPRGALHAVQLHVDLPEEAQRPADIHLDARFERLAVEAHQRWPGIREVSGEISGDLYRGVAWLDAAQAEVAVPWLFRAPLELSTARLELEWTRDADGIHVHAPRLALQNEDGAASGTGSLTIPPGGDSPQLAIEAVARNIRLASAPGYLPVGIMHENLVAWIDRSVQAGRVDEARLSFNGPTRGFPFRDVEGLFRVEFDLAEGALHFHPDWPVATGIEATVRFENEGFQASVHAGQLLEVMAGPANVAIADFAQGMLVVAGDARGELAAFRDFVMASKPLARLLGPGLAPAEVAAGRARAEVDLSLPLRDLSQSRSVVELEISDGVVAYGFLGEPLKDIQARLSIDNARVTAEDASATLAGQPVAADVRVVEGGAIRIEGRGQLNAHGLARVLRVPLDAWAEGQANWTGHLQFPAPGAPAPLELKLASRLQGMGISLPEPFRKAAEEARSLQLRAIFPRAGLMDFELAWDESLTVAARLDRSGPEAVFNAVPGFDAGVPGIVFSGAVGRLDLGEWLRLDVPPEIEAGGIGATIAGGTLLVGELSAPKLEMRDALLELSRGEDHWQLALAAEHGAGTIGIPFALYGGTPVTVRLERLWLDGGETGRAPVAALEPTSIHPAVIPALDIEIADLRYGGLRFGSVSARVLHVGDGIELIGLEGTGEGFMVQAEGHSRLSESVDTSRLNVRISSDDVGATLEYTGFRRSMEAEEGRFDAEVAWQGGLRSDWLSAMTGEAEILIRDGKLVDVEPGAGRMFGLLSIQALPRRLALDFKDVFGGGTAFDRISGDFRFAGGHALTENLVMRGPAANMVVIGRTGIVARDYDQTAVIAADLGRTLPVAGAVVGGPAVAAAVYLLYEMLRKPFQAQITYRLTGPWDTPVIERLAYGSLPPRPELPEEPLAGGGEN
jgi:uncharacterized protein (TIGR02099 family)